MIKRLIIISVALLGCHLATVQGQTISRKVVSNAGGTLTGGNNQITFNIGETVIPTFSAGSSVLTQGFEQPGEALRTGTVATTVCAGSSISVPYIAIDIGGGNTFTAQLSDASGSFAAPVSIGTLAGNASGTINAIIPPNTPQGTGYRIRVVSSSPPLNGSDNGANITINALPTASIAANGPLTFCSGSSVTLTASGGTTYAWSNGATTAATNITTQGTYIVTVTNAAGCTQTTATSIIVQNCCNAIVGNVVIQSTCPGAPLVAQASGYNTQPDYAFYYLLTESSGNIVAVNSTGTFATNSLTVGASYVVYGYNVKATIPVGGPNPPAVGTNVNSITGTCFSLSPSSAVVIGTTVTIPLAGNSSEGASNGTSPFTYNTTTIKLEGGVAPYNFDWITNGYVRYYIVYTATGVTITVYYTDNADWSVTVSDSNECTTGLAVFDNLADDDNTLLDIDSYAVTPPNLGDDGSIILNASGGDFSCGTYQYEWSGPDTWTGSYATTGTGSYTINNLSSGWYSVTITDCGGNTTEGWYWVPEGSRGRTKTIETLSVMPNPFAGKAIVEFTVNATGNTTVNVFSMDGKQVATLYNANAKAGETYQVNLDGTILPSGMYFVEMTNANGKKMLTKAMVSR
ncbi:MAG: T9SS type A sorting domain-containing protein [Chitinophagales bacterium]|nr:T9SS type A sorting domain-containing protein [Chitinophagales bacterium]